MKAFPTPSYETAVSSGAANYPGLDDWRSLPIKQQPLWQDHPNYASAMRELSEFPPLVFAGEVDVLKKRLGEAVRGEAFVLMGGDCAETFSAVTANNISARIKTILQMAVVLTYGASMPVVKMGRMAGQYAKPRSSDMETRDGVTLPSFRGEIINGFEFTEEARTPDPQRMVQAYHSSAATLNLIRAFTHGGFADLRSVHSWNQGFMANPAHARYEQLAKEIDRAIRFMEAAGADFEVLKRAEFYSAHEALLLDYERPLTRIDSRTGLPYGTSAHYLWIGERTREPDGAHVDFLSRIQNPIGVKVGPQASADELKALIDKLNPDGVEGRLTFISRMGAGQVRESLPGLVKAVQDLDAPVLWVCDPMHGNTVTSANGYKTRKFDDVLAELQGFFAVHRELGSFPGGLHVEMTGDDVAECLGGSDPINESAFADRYETLCDPRLNHRQSLELAFLVSEALTQQN